MIELKSFLFLSKLFRIVYRLLFFLAPTIYAELLNQLSDRYIKIPRTYSEIHINKEIQKILTFHTNVELDYKKKKNRFTNYVC